MSSGVPDPDRPTRLAVRVGLIVWLAVIVSLGLVLLAARATTTALRRLDQDRPADSTSDAWLPRQADESAARKPLQSR